MPDTLTTRPPAAPAPANGTPGQPRSGSSKAGYWMAAMVATLGLAAAIAFGLIGTLRTLDRPDGFARAAIPGTLTVTGPAGGRQVVYYEGDTRPGWRGLDVRVIGPDGAAVPVIAYRGDRQYAVNARLA